MNYWTKKFKQLNNKYWDGRLSTIKVIVRDLSKDRAEGLYHYPYDDNKAMIEIDKNLTHHEKTNILLHEMCHHAVEEFYEERPYHDHGSEWKKEMRRCGFIGRISSSRGRYKTKAG
jgi:hypothetical protein